MIFIRYFNLNELLINDIHKNKESQIQSFDFISKIKLDLFPEEFKFELIQF